MAVVIPEEVLSATRMTGEEILTELAVALFQREKLTLAQAAHLAGMHRIQFQHLLASRKIPVHYDVDELKADLANLRKVRSQ